MVIVGPRIWVCWKAESLLQKAGYLEDIVLTAGCTPLPVAKTSTRIGVPGCGGMLVTGSTVKLAMGSKSKLVTDVPEGALEIAKIGLSESSFERTPAPVMISGRVPVMVAGVACVPATIKKFPAGTNKRLPDA